MSITTCAGCGAVAPGDGTPPYTWSVSLEGGRASHYCEACARTHLRSIEGKLDPEWW